MTRASDTARILSGGVVINEDSNDVDLRVESNGNANMLFVDAGNDRVGIGTSPSGALDILSPTNTVPLIIKSTTDTYNYSIIRNAAGNDVGYVGLGTALISGADADDFVIRAQRDNLIFTAGGSTERMRILGNGRVHIGDATSSDAFSNLSSSGNILVAGIGSGFGDNAHVYNVGGFTGPYDLIVFRNGNGVVGTITINGSATTYSTSSDYRLKENVADITDGITRVKQLKPSRFNFIADDTNTLVDGFLAHEAQTVVPEAVTGTKDELEVWKEHEELPDGVSVGDNKLDDNGNTIPKMQGVDQSKLVPLLTAALQEAIAKIETLETKVAALEAEQYGWICR